MMTVLKPDSRFAVALMVSACVVAFTASVSRAAPITLGVGNVSSVSNDGAFTQIVVDRNVTQSVAAGDHRATFFNYQVTGTPSGTITPLVLISPSTNVYTVVAMGSTITPSGLTSFISAPFGGSDAFTLGSATTIYGGFYWDATAVSNPIGFTPTGNVWSVYSGAATPVVGVDIAPTTGGGAALERTYDFSVTVETPEPGTAAMLVGVSGMAMRRRAGGRPIAGRA